ncbi:hypothetical protein CJ255_21845, partial [Candidatus Viridilinea mediisalina]
CPMLGRQRATGLLYDPMDATLREDLAWYLEESWRWPFGEFAERAQQLEARMEQVGRAFFAALFATAAGQQIFQPWNVQDNYAKQLSLELDLTAEQLAGEAPTDRRLFAALSLPWELLHDGRTFLTLRLRQPVSIVRRLPEPNVQALLQPFTPPLRVLLVTARPDETGFIDPRGIARPLFAAVEEALAEGQLQVEFLRPPTLPALVARLNAPQQPPIHILHFDGHGTFGPQGQPSFAQDGVRFAIVGQGALAFEHEDGQAHLVAASDLAAALGQSGIKLALLTACKSATSAEDDAFSSVAGQLIRGGLDAVIAMPASLLVATATKLVQCFYASLARGTPVPLALQQARQQLHADPRRHLLQRQRDRPGAPITLRDWWLPHYYMQRALDFQPQAGAAPVAAPVAAPPLSNFPAPPRYGFGGRARELHQIERALQRGQAVLIHGFGGQGKTSLACEAATWLSATGMFSGACFISAEASSGGATWLLASLARHLGCADGHFHPDNHTTALAQLRPHLRQRRTLIVLDNLESWLPEAHQHPPHKLTQSRKAAKVRHTYRQKLRASAPLRQQSSQHEEPHPPHKLAQSRKAAKVRHTYQKLRAFAPLRQQPNQREEPLPLPPAALSALWDLLDGLRAAGAGLLLTSREPSLPDPR